MLVLIVLMAVVTAGSILVAHGLAKLAMPLMPRPVQVAAVVIPLGTCLPAMTLSVGSGWMNPADLGLRAVIGANLINVLLVAPVCALIRPIRMSDGLLRQFVGLAAAAGLSLLATAVGLDRFIGGLEGIVLAVGAVVVWWFVLEHVFGNEKQRQIAVQLDPPAGRTFGGPGFGRPAMWTGLTCTLLGLAGIVFAGYAALPRWPALASAIQGHKLAGVLLPGALVAGPQLFFALAAVRQRAGELALAVILGGYVVGCLFVVGATAALIGFQHADQRMFYAVRFSAALWQQHAIPMWLAVMLLLPCAIGGDSIGWVEAVILLLCFAGYAAYVLWV